MWATNRKICEQALKDTKKLKQTNKNLLQKFISFITYTAKSRA